MSAAEEKAALRRVMLARRRALTAEEIASMRRPLTENLLLLPAYQNARRILAYLALPREADLDDFIQSALADGKEIYVPVCLADHQMEAGRLRDMEHFVHGSYGLRDLPKGYETISAEELDLVLVPAVACDRKGNRLGHGAGYYDRYLPRVAEEKRIAVIWDFQITDTVPTEENDCRMAGVVTEKEVLGVDLAAHP